MLNNLFAMGHTYTKCFLVCKLYVCPGLLYLSQVLTRCAHKISKVHLMRRSALVSLVGNNGIHATTFSICHGNYQKLLNISYVVLSHDP